MEQYIDFPHRSRTALGIVQAKTAFDAWIESGALGSCDLHDVDVLDRDSVWLGPMPLPRRVTRHTQGRSTQTVHALPYTGSSTCRGGRMRRCIYANLLACFTSWLAGRAAPALGLSPCNFHLGLCCRRGCRCTRKSSQGSIGMPLCQHNLHSVSPKAELGSRGLRRRSGVDL